MKGILSRILAALLLLTVSGADAGGGLKGPARLRRSLRGLGGGQPPTSECRVYTGALLAVTFSSTSTVLPSY